MDNLIEIMSVKHNIPDFFQRCAICSRRMHGIIKHTAPPRKICVPCDRKVKNKTVLVRHDER